MNKENTSLNKQTTSQRVRMRPSRRSSARKKDKRLSRRTVYKRLRLRHLGAGWREERNYYPRSAGYKSFQILINVSHAAAEEQSDSVGQATLTESRRHQWWHCPAVSADRRPLSKWIPDIALCLSWGHNTCGSRIDVSLVNRSRLSSTGGFWRQQQVKIKEERKKREWKCIRKEVVGKVHIIFFFYFTWIFFFPKSFTCRVMRKFV